MSKRILDIILSAAGLLFAAPFLLVAALLVWLQDFHSPLYIAERVGRGRQPFRMIKIRSMIVAADRSGVDSTAGHDPRITRVGTMIRRWKLDELPQLLNVLGGSMSLVGPRPNTPREVAGYSATDVALLSVRPGITDISSIIFSDEGEILRGAADPDARYRAIIWPWKSAFGLLYVRNAGLWLDLKLIAITLVAIIDREAALRRLHQVLVGLNASDTLLQVASRRVDLAAFAPQAP